MSTATKQQPKNGDVIEGTATEIVVRDEPDGLFKALDRLDEQQVELEIQGGTLEALVYDFKVGGKPAKGLSYSGVNLAVRVLNARGVARIQCPPSPRPRYKEVVDDEGDPAWECEVYAIDELTGGGAWGLATQKRFMKLSDENAIRRHGASEIPDTFAKTKALSKAQRNAKSALIDERLKAMMIAEFSKQKNGGADNNGRRGRAVQHVPSQAETKHREKRQSNSPDAQPLDEENKQRMDALGYLPAKRDALLRGHKTIAQKRQLNDRLQKELEENGGQS